MTKKNFIALADVIKRHTLDIAKAPFSTHHIHALADFCESQSPNFNRSRWLDYIAGKCGPNGGKKS